MIESTSSGEWLLPGRGTLHLNQSLELTAYLREFALLSEHDAAHFSLLLNQLGDLRSQ